MQNVLVVGLGLSSTEAVKSLAGSLPQTHRLVIVTATDGYWPIAGLRAAVVPGWESKPVAPLDYVLPPNSRHILIKGTSVVEMKLNSAVMDKPHAELGSEIPFEYALLATGSSYPFPCRPHPGSTSEETVTALRQLQTDLASSSSVLVIGGGPVGVEYTGEVAAQYRSDKAKKVTLVHSHEVFLYEPGWKPKFNQSMERQLKELGVELKMGRKVVEGGLQTGKVEGGERTFKLDNGEEVKADFVFVAHGNSPNTGFIGAFDPALLNAQKQVAVKPSFQLKSDDGRYDHIFAMGDITDVQESKLALHAGNHVPIFTKNLLALILAGGPKSASPPALKSYSPGGKMIGISIGPNGGAGQFFFGIVFPPWLMAFAKSKTLFVDKFEATYNKPKA
ncbi:hypothetical protein JCM10213_004178 [Rhodosporidiobolus nylandii]